MSIRSASTVRADHIEYSFWLIFDRNGALRMTRQAPGTDRNERAMLCSATLPKSLFATPTLKATISIDDVPAPDFQFDVHAVANVIKQTIGVDIDLKVEQIP